MSKVDFLNKISAGQDTEWLKEAMWRRENAAWLKKFMDKSRLLPLYQHFYVKNSQVA